MGYINAATLTEQGWDYEGPDESVGIFGHSVWHEKCPKWPDENDDCTPAETLGIKFTPKDGYTEIRVRTRFTCPFCGATADVYEYDVAPHDDQEEWN